MLECKEVKEYLEPEFAMVDKSGTFKETVLTMLG